MLTNQRFVSKAVDVQLARKKMSQSALAAQIGISKNYMNRILNNKVSWNLSLMDKVGEALGLGDLFGLMELAEDERRTEQRLTVQGQTVCNTQEMEVTA